MTCPAWHRTKIVCTLGPSTEQPGIPEAMIRAGMRVARVNTAHGTPAGHVRRIRQVREAARRADRTVGVLVDLPGPKFRLGRLAAGSLDLRRGARVLLGPVGEARPDAIPFSHPRLAREVRPGEELFLADGTVKLAVRRVQGPHIFCQVTAGGTVRSGSGLNFPQSKIDVRLPTAEDARWIRFARAQKVEWVGVSFVRSAADLVRVRRLLGPAGANAPLVMAKIEKREALDRLEEIVEEADGVMVARGDLGVETPLEEVPVVQKRIIALAESRGKPVVTATQMLESMVENPSPTRAEVTDVANAILDGTDAVMLSAETAVGKYPVEAVRVLCAVGGATEANYPFGMPLRTFSLGRETSVEDAMSAVACRLSFDVKAKAILVPGGSCRTAFRVARFRPQAPVVVASRSLLHARQLSVAWNVHPVLVRAGAGAGAWLEPARRWLQERRLARSGDPLIVISPPAAGARNAGESVQVIRL